MTVATQQQMGGKAGGGSPARHGGGLGKRGGGMGAAGNPWRRLWQIPLLILGAGAFALGLQALVRTIRPVPFERQVTGIKSLLNDGEYDKAIAQINVMGQYYREPRQFGELQILAGDAIFLAQRGLPAVRENYEHVLEHYRNAVKLGIDPTVQVNQRWGEAALALGDSQVAIERLEGAIRGKPVLVKQYARQLTDAYTSAGQPERALDIVKRTLGEEESSPAGEMDLESVEERTWGLCKRIEIALAMREQAKSAKRVPEKEREAMKTAGEAALEEALTGARAALSTLRDRDPAGRVLAWIGRGEWEKGETEKAQDDLAEARKQFAVHHLDDGRAAVLLGRIAEAKGAFAEAGKLFEEVAEGHEGTRIWAAARLGRAEVGTRNGRADEQSLADYRFVIQTIRENEDADEKPAVGEERELISRDGVRASLIAAYERARAAAEKEHGAEAVMVKQAGDVGNKKNEAVDGEAAAGGLGDALQFLLAQQALAEPETADMARRLATTREQIADDSMAAALTDKEKPDVKGVAEARATYAQAAEDYVRYAKLTTLNEAESGNALWKAAELFDRAGRLTRAATVYEQFTVQRPRDARVPDGLLALGRLYESDGEVEKAIGIYQRNIKENPKTPAAYASTVNVARAYQRQADGEKKPEDAAALREKAEKVLLAMVQDNTDILPAAREFRESLMALGELYYREGRWAEAILRLEEVAARYPNDAGMPRTVFLLGESYRKFAEDIAEALKDPGVGKRMELEAARMDRLATAAGHYTRVIELLDNEAKGEAVVAMPELSGLETMYLRSSYMNRAECYFQRGEYETAIRFYDQAAARFAEETVAAEAYVQIVNAYGAMKEPAKAKTAAERGEWILKRIPDAAFKEAGTGVDRGYYERLLAMSRN